MDSRCVTPRGRRAHGFLPVLIVVLASAGCSDAEPSKDSTPADAGVLPCFPETGEPVLEVEGVPVPEATIDRFADVVKARTPGLSDQTARMNAIEQVIVQQAAIYTLYRDRMEELTRRAREAKKRIDAGEEFAEVAKEMSDEPNGRKGGNLGFLGRAAGVMSPALEDVAFTTPVGSVSPPFVTVLGVVIVHVISEKPGMSARLDQRELAQILLHFDPDVAKAFRAFDESRPETSKALENAMQEFKVKVKQAVDSARIKVLDPKLQSLVYPFRLEK